MYSLSLIYDLFITFASAWNRFDWLNLCASAWNRFGWLNLCDSALNQVGWLMVGWFDV